MRERLRDVTFPLAFLLSLLVAVSAAAGEAESKGEGGSKPGTCPSPCPEQAIPPVSSGSANPPEEIFLNGISDIFEGAPFSHGAHAELADACASCHHHSPPDVYQPCNACHPKERSRLDQFNAPGLKGAYHLQCMGCHETYGSGPTDCTGCHKMRPNSSLTAP